MKLLIQRYFSLWAIDYEAAAALTAIIIVWLVVIIEMVYMASQ